MMGDSTKYGYLCGDCGAIRWDGAPGRLDYCDECGGTNLGTLTQTRPARYIDLTEGEDD